MDAASGTLEDFSKVTVDAQAAGSGLIYGVEKQEDSMDTHSQNSSHSNKRIRLNNIAKLLPDGDDDNDDDDAESLMSD